MSSFSILFSPIFNFRSMKTVQKMLFVAILFITFITNANASMMADTLPYFEIPSEPETFTAATVAARIVDGLGYRYYWATEGLRDEDLAYDPGNDGKICSEVLDHLAGLSNFILTAVHKEVTGTRKVPEGLSWEQKRAFTLNAFKEISDILKATGDVSEYKVVFQREDQISEFPFWNLINGPIADAIYHTGQIVSYRRSTGNPSNPNVNVFRGKTKQ